MTKEQIHASLDSMLANPKGKNFLNHLVRSYFPFTNVKKVLEKPEGDFKCVLTRDSLFSVQDVMNIITSEEYKKLFMSNLKHMFSEDGKFRNPVSEIIGDKKIGFTGKDTTTFISFDAYQEFYLWLTNKMLTGDKHINWLMHGIRKASIEKEKDAKPKVDSRAKFSLGETNDVLMKLKAKMEQNEN